MDYSELVKARYSVRAYKSDPVEDDKLHRILEAARLAPTAANRQPVQIIVAKTEGRQDELRRVYRSDWFVQAPLVICVCAAPSEAWVRRYDGKNHCDVDATIAMDHLILAAANEGLGTCWIAAFDPDAAREVFGLEDDLQPVLLTPLGYAADSAGPKNRKPIEEIVRFI